MSMSLASIECSHKLKWSGHLNFEGFWRKPILSMSSVDAETNRPIPVPLQTAEEFYRHGVVPADGLPIRIVELKEGQQPVKLVGKDGADRCFNPVLFVCSEGCGMFLISTCNSRDAEVCGPCELRYRNRVRAIARIPMLVAKTGSTYMITLTGPGVKRHCLTHTYKDKNGKLQPSTRCDWEVFDRNEIPFENDGRSCVECPCSENRLVFHEDLQVFNSTISRKFNDFITDIRRTFPEFEKVQYFRANEPQKRGVLHIHVILIMKRAVKIDSVMSERLTNIAMRLGFGHQVDIRQLGTGELDQVTAARYVAKYVSKTEAHSSVPYWDERVTYEVDEQSGELKMILIPRRRPRTWSASRRWGLSMTRIVLHQSAAASGREALSEEILELGLAWLKEWQDDGLLLA